MFHLNVTNYFYDVKLYTYTGCPILNNTLRFLENYGKYKKNVSKVIWFGERHKKIPLI